MKVVKRVYYVLALQGAGLSALHGLSHYFSQHLYEVDSGIIPILQTRKLRFSELKLCAPMTQFKKWQNWNFNLGLWDLRLFITLHLGRGWRSRCSMRHSPLLRGGMTVSVTHEPKDLGTFYFQVICIVL